MGSRIRQRPVVVRKTEKLGERERKALFPSKGKGNDDEIYILVICLISLI